MIKERVFENDIIEVKQKLDRNDPESWLKTVVGFANYKGGTFYIGAEDGNFKLIGFDSYSADKERNYFYNLVNFDLSYILLESIISNCIELQLNTIFFISSMVALLVKPSLLI